ncbi:MAG: septum formation initiator family protein [Sphingobacteriia bacterium]|nr:septum formation initiator family protein [Sphingobacteriia bacterium]
MYFIYHTIIGQRGILALMDLTGEVENLQREIEDIRAERLLLDHKVNLLKSESLDLDLVEQQAKEVLGLADPKEEVILLEKDKK